MASITSVTGSNTPNEGRLLWNANDTAINNEVISATAAIAAATGGLVGRTQTQTLTNKTMVSSYRGGTNTFSISRRDLETSLFIVTSNSGAVSNVDVTQSSLYSLQLLGANGIDTYVTADVLYIRNSPTCILNATSQVLGVKVASVTAGNIAEFGGNVKINSRLAIGAEHTSQALTGLHLKEDGPELRIETVASGIAKQSYVDDSGNDFTWAANFITPGANFLDLSWDSNQLIRFSPTLITVTPNIRMNGTSNYIYGDLTVTGILTAGTLNATSTDIVVNNGPVHITGDTSHIHVGGLSWSYLPGGTAFQFLTAGYGSTAPSFSTIGGDLYASSSPGYLYIANDVVTSIKIYDTDSWPSNTLITGSSGRLASRTNNANGDVSFTISGTTIRFDIDSGVIDNDNIATGAEIAMSKTAFEVNISGMELHGNVLELAPDNGTGPKPDVLFRTVPVGTVISYAGKLTGLPGDGSFYEPPEVPGWLFCNGAEYNIGTYRELHYKLLDSWGTGYLPNLQGMFLRGVDPTSIGYDEGKENRTGGQPDKLVGSSQDDQPGYHSHDIRPFATTAPPGGGAYTAGGSTGMMATEAAGGTQYTDEETRPKNMGIVYLIKY